MSMNLTEQNMQEKLVNTSKQICSISDDIIKFDPNISSYYLKYEDSKHIKDVIMVYDFDSPISLNEYLDDLWNDKGALKQTIIEILMSMKTENGHLLEEVQGFNYTL